MDCLRVDRAGNPAAVYILKKSAERLAAHRCERHIGPVPQATVAPHYWLGYLLLVLGVIHTVVPMQAGHLRQWNIAGLWIATVALLMMLLQGALGL
jgi:uncharacterized membrane protein